MENSDQSAQNWGHGMTRLLDRQDESWRRGNFVLIEDLVRDNPQILDDSDLLLDLIMNEKSWRDSLGLEQQLAFLAQEYCVRFPQHAEAIERQFQFEQIVTRLPDPKVSLTANNDISNGDGERYPIIDRYRIKEIIGRGGSGVVYRAEDSYLETDQTETRIVALKMLRDDDRSPVAAAVLYADAIKLATLQHRHIINIYHVGIHDGKPFISMPYYARKSLADHIGKYQGGPVTESLKLLAVVAEPVRHAHASGFLHCDLKPANILMDNDDYPIVTDFGLAIHLPRGVGTADPNGSPITNGDENTLGLSSFNLGGTREYMAPEQWRWDRSMLSVRTDVYGLGAILYHLLTGQPPGGTTGWSKPVPVRKLAPHISHDVEAVCLKCLAENPDDRYQDIGKLADDLQRCLEGRPVGARPLVGISGALLRTLKWGKRNKSLAALCIALILGIPTFMTTQIIHNARLSTQLHATEAARDFAASSTFKFAKLSAERASQKDAVVNYEQTLDIYNDLVRTSPENSWYLLGKARTLNNLAVLKVDQRQGGGAKGMLDEARALLEGLSKQPNPQPDVKLELSNTLTNLGNHFSRSDQFDEALACYRAAEILRSELAAAYPDDVNIQLASAKAETNFGHLFENMSGRGDEAVRHYETAINRLLRLVEAHPDDLETNDNLLVATAQVSLLYRNLGRLKDAEQLFTMIIRRTESILKNTPHLSRIRCIHATGLMNLGNCLVEAGKFNLAVKSFAESIESLRSLTSESPANIQYKFYLGSALENLGSCHQKALKLGPARAALQESIEILKEVDADASGIADHLRSLANAEATLGCVEFLERNFEAGRADFTRSLADIGRIKQADLEASLITLGTLNNLARIEHDTDQLEPANDAATRGLKEGLALAKANPKNIAVRAILVRLYDVRGMVELKRASSENPAKPDPARLRAALAAHDEAVKIHAEAKAIGTLAADDQTFVSEPHAHAAAILQMSGKTDEALVQWDLAVKAIDLSNPRRQLYRIYRLATLIQTGRYAEVAKEAGLIRSEPLPHRDSRYNLACVYSLAFGMAGKDRTLTETRCVEVRKAYLAAAISLLEEGRQKGEFNDENILQGLMHDPDFAPIRDQPLFQAFLDAIRRDRSAKPG